MDAKLLVPKFGPDEAAELLGDSEHWRNFARRIQHHPYVFRYLKEKQSGRCPVCNLGLEGGMTIHHVSYLNRCLHESVCEISTPTPKRPNKKVKAPPCEGCEKLPKCAALLALVHNGCHIKIHTLENEIKSRSS